MKKTVRVLALFLALTMGISLLASCGKKQEEDALGKIKNQGYIVIATEGDWSPWTYHDEDNVLTGFDVELGQIIATKLGVEAHFEETAWDSILAGVEAGRFDVACNGVSYTEERAEKFDFSTPYVYTGAVIVTLKDNTDIKSLEDLKGKTTANTASSTYAAMAEEAGATVQSVDSLMDTLNLVMDGRVDATLNARVTVEAYLKEHPESPLMIACDVPGEQMVIPVRKSAETASLLAEIDRILEELRQDGTLAALSVKYFGADLTKPQ